MPAKKRRPADKIPAILAAAKELFSRNGYEATSVADIAQLAGVAGGTIIYHFKSKENLLFILVRQILFSLYKELRNNVALQFQPMDRLEAYVRVFFNFVTAHQDEHLVLLKTDPFKILQLDTPPVSDLKFIYSQHRQLLQIIIEEGMAKGDFHHVNAQACSAAIFSMLTGMGRYLLFDSSQSHAALEREAFRFIRARLQPSATFSQHSTSHDLEAS